MLLEEFLQPADKSQVAFARGTSPRLWMNLQSVCREAKKAGPCDARPVRISLR